MLGEIGFSRIFDLYESTETDYNVFVEKSVVENNQTDRIQFDSSCYFKAKSTEKILITSNVFPLILHFVII